MSKAASSPTARLLQSSRLFSLPRPLPIQPDLSSGLYRTSETATTAHPTQQAITTPPSSLFRGDWGLKRAIPSRKTHSSTPAIRVRANDTYEHITDFTSAGDHVQTRRKFAEMGVPFVKERKGKQQFNQEAPMSVFEEWLDNTDPEAKYEQPAPQVASYGAAETPQRSLQRWKHKGPWLAGMQEGEFEKFLSSKQQPGPSNQPGPSDRTRWRKHLGKEIMAEKKEAAELEARDAEPSLQNYIWGDHEADAIRAEAERQLVPTNEERKDFEKRLRDEHASMGLSSPLTRIISEFLDLPNVHVTRDSLSQRSTTGGRFFASDAEASTRDNSEAGPPSTHPAAGLSHLRTNAFMHNHPLYGPQKDQIPVEARVVRPRTRLGANQEHIAKLGVGGFVSDDSATATSGPLRSRHAKDLAHQLDEQAEGGNKIWVVPETASVDHKSRVRLAISRAGQEGVAIRTGDEKKIREIVEMKGGRRSGGMSGGLSEAMLAARGARGVTPRRRPEVTGFDDELARARSSLGLDG